MACSVSNMNMTLPRIRTVTSDCSTSPPSPSILPGLDLFTSNATKKEVDDEPFVPPRLTFPLTAPKDIETNYVRRESTCSTSSAPSLEYSNSPSPSPPPTRPSSPDCFLLVPCDMRKADAVVMITERLMGDCDTRESSPSSPFSSPIFRPCKPSEARATLLIGPAISAHARRSAARLHPYRIVRERRI